MLHYLLVIISYIGFIGLVYAIKIKPEQRSVRLAVPVTFGIFCIFFLNIVYESILQFALLHNVKSHAAYISFAAIGSGLYMIFYFAGLVILANMMECDLPNLWTIIFFVITLVINIILMTKSSSIMYEEIYSIFGSNTFDNLYETLSQTTRPAAANMLLNLKWIVMICPGVFYLMQVLSKRTSED